MDSADSPLAVHCVHVDRPRQLRIHDARATSRMGDVLTTASTRAAAIQRPVPLCPALHEQIGRRRTRLIATSELTMTTNTKATAKATARASSGEGDWRNDTLARMRTLILEADPEMTEE